MKYTPLTTEELNLFKQRLTFMGGLLILLLLVVISRTWYLQVIEGDYYYEVSQGNRIRVIPQGAPRGILYDRNGEILAFNRPAFDIQLIREDTPDLTKTLANLSRVTATPVSVFREAIAANKFQAKFKALPMLRDVGRKMADLVDTYQEDLPGISVAVEPKRLYPSAFLTSHVLGYVGVINEDQLTNLPIKKLYSGRIVGQAGIELVRNKTLIGLDGGRQVEVDYVGRELRILSRPVNPVPGSDIHLTIDLRLQRYIRSLMSGKNGVVLVSNPRTGEILAMSSFPDYDPNLFIGGIEGKNWDELTTEGKHPLINKAVQGIYPPGSIFKMVLAAAALTEEEIDENTIINCPGYYRINRDVRFCWNLGGHGDVNLAEALRMSCNVYFYHLGQTLGVEKISKYARMFGFGAVTGIEMESEKSGLLPSKAWKLRVMKEKWYLGDTIPISIGQGFLTVTPIQIINYINTLANNGLWVRPTLIRKIVTPEGKILTSERDLPRDTRLLPIPVEYFAYIREGMVQSVNANGTGKRAKSRLFTIAGKTGTSEVIGRKSGRWIEKKDDIDELLLPHAMFVGYAPAEAPRVTVLVLVEHGKSGGITSAPIGKKILEFYSKNIASLEFKDSGFQTPEIRTPGRKPVNFRSEIPNSFQRSARSKQNKAGKKRNSGSGSPRTRGGG